MAQASLRGLDRTCSNGTRFTYGGRYFAREEEVEVVLIDQPQECDTLSLLRDVIELGENHFNRFWKQMWGWRGMGVLYVPVTHSHPIGIRLSD